MNPYDAVGTARVSPALYDRSCRVALGYQDEDIEAAIVARMAPGPADLVSRSVRAVRMTREHPDLRIGSSVRGAIDIVLVASELAAVRGEAALSERTGLDAARTALSGKVTVQEGCPRSVDEIIEEIWGKADPGKR